MKIYLAYDHWMLLIKILPPELIICQTILLMHLAKTGRANKLLITVRDSICLSLLISSCMYAGFQYCILITISVYCPCCIIDKLDQSSPKLLLGLTCPQGSPVMKPDVPLWATSLISSRGQGQGRDETEYRRGSVCV